MKKNDVFTFTAPNGAKVIAVVIDEVGRDYHLCWCYTIFLCYAQNRLFTYLIKERTNSKFEIVKTVYEYGKVLVDYAVLPDYDGLLARYNDIDVAQAETQSEM